MMKKNSILTIVVLGLFTHAAFGQVYEDPTSGNVGIGTTTIDNSQGWDKVLQLHGPRHAKLLVTDNGGVKVGMFADHLAKIGTESQHDLSFTAGYWNDVMTLKTNGSVGIGTTTIDNSQGWDKVLQLHGPRHAKLLVTDNGGVKVGMFADHLAKIGTESQHDLSFTAGYWNDVMTLKTNGSVGIGTTTIDNSQGWDKVLQLHGPRHAKLLVTDNGGVKVGMFADHLAKIGTESQHDLSFTAGYWNDVMTLKTNGNVGIGTTTPNEKLAVNGKIRAKEIKVETANWPDYVFDDGYKITSLNDLERYIKANKHLPGMPSAKEIENNGLALGEMVKQQQKKIEELTLYIIEQNKMLFLQVEENKIQDDQLKHLKLEIENLKRK